MESLFHQKVMPHPESPAAELRGWNGHLQGYSCAGAGNFHFY